MKQRCLCQRLTKYKGMCRVSAANQNQTVPNAMRRIVKKNKIAGEKQTYLQKQVQVFVDIHTPNMHRLYQRTCVEAQKM